jgi:DNA-binding beta-propeller fold protein YncE
MPVANVTRSSSAFAAPSKETKSMKKTVIALALAAGLASFVGAANAQTLFVSNYSGNTISKVTASGSVSTFSSSPLLNAPYGMAFGASGDLFVANSGANSILKLAPSGTATVFSSDPLLKGPSGLVFDASGNMFVANFGDSNVLKITPSGSASVFASGTLFNLGLQQNLWVGTGSEEASPRPPRGSDGRVVIAQCVNRSAR